MRKLFLLFLVTIIIVLALAALPGDRKDERKSESQRVYPPVIKGNWEPSTSHMDTLLSEEIGGLKGLGVNTLSVVPHYDYVSGKPALRDGKESYAKRIAKAKQAGFAVLLVPDFVGGDNQKATVSLSQFLSDSRNISLEWAKFAQEYQVEYFAPQNEFDWVIRFSFFDNAPEKFEEGVNISNKWHEDILPELKRVFKGKTIYKIASESEKSVAKGYDYIGLDFGHYQNNLKEFRERINKAYRNAEVAAKQSGAGWIVGEAWMPYRERHGPAIGDVLKNSNGESIDDLQDDYFRIATEEYLNFSGEIKPSGFVFIAYIMPGMDVKGRPAEAVLKDFFEKL